MRFKITVISELSGWCDAEIESLDTQVDKRELVLLPDEQIDELILELISLMVPKATLVISHNA